MSTNCSCRFVSLRRPQVAAGPRVERERRACRSRRRAGRRRARGRSARRSAPGRCTASAASPSARSSAYTDELRSCSVDGRADDERRRREGAEGRAARQREAPADVEPADGARRDRGRRRRACPAGRRSAAPSRRSRTPSGRAPQAEAAASSSARRLLEDGEVPADLAVDLVRELAAVVEERAELALLAGGDRRRLQAADVEDVRLRCPCSRSRSARASRAWRPSG